VDSPINPLIRYAPDPDTSKQKLIFAGMSYRVFWPVAVDQAHRFLPNGPTREVEVLWLKRLAAQNGQLVVTLLSRIALEACTIESTARVLMAIEAPENILIEGPPATSKNSSLELGCALVGLPVLRVNLSAGSHPTDLIGKFAPATDGETGWRWSNGPVPTAMQGSCMLNLDEGNLALAGVLDRLASLADADRKLRLSEYDDRELVAHPDFRLAITMNSATEEGRRLLSRPLRSRFVHYFPRRPGEAEFLATARHWAFGQPAAAVEFDGQSWSLPKVEPLLPALGRVEQHEELLPLIARFHTAVAARCEERAIGRDRREPYVFDRRTYFAFFRSLNHALANAPRHRADVTPLLQRVLGQHYVQAVEPGPDREAVQDQGALIEIRRLHLTLATPGCPPRRRT